MSFDMSFDPSIILASRILSAFVFGAAVVGKLRHHQEFVGVVANYRLLPDMVVAPAAWSIIIVESLIVFSLGSGLGQFVGASVAMLMLCLFALAMAINIRRGRRDIDCGCFQSALRQHLSGALVVRNMLLSATLLPLLLSAGRVSWQLLTPLQLFNGIGGGVVLFTLYHVFGQLLALRKSAETLDRRFA